MHCKIAKSPTVGVRAASAGVKNKHTQNCGFHVT